MSDKYCIIVGNGDLPKLVIDALRRQNQQFVLAGIKGVSSYFLVNSHEHFWFYMGVAQQFLDQAKLYGCNKIILVGAVKRPSLLNMRYDSLGKQLVLKYLQNKSGDSSFLQGVVSIFEDYGFTVIAPHVIAPEILSKSKLYTKVNFLEEDIPSIKTGFLSAKGLGALDIGQGVIVQNNIVITAEATEGTSAMIKRSKALHKKGIRGGILVKTKKDQQTDKVDLPSIGSKTVKQAKKAGLVGIVIESNSSIILNESETVSLADKYGIFILSLTASEIQNLKWYCL